MPVTIPDTIGDLWVGRHTVPTAKWVVTNKVKLIVSIIGHGEKTDLVNTRWIRSGIGVAQDNIPEHITIKVDSRAAARAPPHSTRDRRTAQARHARGREHALALAETCGVPQRSASSVCLCAMPVLVRLFWCRQPPFTLPPPSTQVNDATLKIKESRAWKTLASGVAKTLPRIHHYMAKGANVLVHSKNGLCKGPCLLICYLMTKWDFPLDICHKWMEERHPRHDIAKVPPRRACTRACTRTCTRARCARTPACMPARVHARAHVHAHCGPPTEATGSPKHLMRILARARDHTRIARKHANTLSLTRTRTRSRSRSHTHALALTHTQHAPRPGVQVRARAAL